MRKFAATSAAAVALLLSGCATASNGPDLKAVHYAGGVASAKKYVNCLDPSERSGYNPGDKYYAYPVRQISYDATGGKGAETAPPTVIASDGGSLEVPYTVTLFLKNDCESLRKFHETIGTRFTGYIEVNDKSDATSADYPDGWVTLLNFVIGKPFDVALDRAAQGYTQNELWRDPEAKQALDDAITQAADEMIAQQAGGDFFENAQVLVQKPVPPQELLDAVTQKQTELEKIATEKARVLAEAEKARAEAEADALTAQAQIKTARAEKISRELEVQGYGGPRNYLMHECIQLAPECVWKQPTYVIGYPGGVPKQ